MVFAAKAERRTPAGSVASTGTRSAARQGILTRGRQRLRAASPGQPSRRAHSTANPTRGRRGPAGRRRDDEPGQPDRAVGDVGRDVGRRPPGVRRRGSSAPARRAHFADRQQRRSRSRLRSSDSTRADITFSGNTPYVTWRESVGGVTTAFVGHFVNAANPTFVLDESDVPLTPTAQADVREPISSSCTANPFNADGAACQGGAVGTPFFLFTNGTSPRGSVRRRLPAGHAGDRRGERRDHLGGDRERDGQSGGRAGQGVVPVRHDARVRTDAPRAQTLAPGNAATPFTATADRSAGRNHDPLPRGRGERLRDVRRRR